MSQFFKPISDIETSGWVTTPLYTKIDETSPSDADFISTAAKVTVPQDFECDLTALSDPNTAKDCRVKVRYKKDAGGGAIHDWVAKLKQGGVTKYTDSWTGGDHGNWATRSRLLTEAQMNSITDFSDLSLYVEVTPQFALPRHKAHVSWMQFVTPDVVLTAIFNATLYNATIGG